MKTLCILEQSAFLIESELQAKPDVVNEIIYPFFSLSVLYANKQRDHWTMQLMQGCEKLILRIVCAIYSISRLVLRIVCAIYSIFNRFDLGKLDLVCYKLSFAPDPLLFKVC